ncbi:MAG: hypothetical protein JWL72_855 [Ilumatobacteraceae bacterium]|nr:hypothetical protein [Ilumatobacteraceae bacterium]
MCQGGSVNADAVPNLARPAATVIITRPRPDDPEAGLEVLLLKRSDVGAFAGMWVFPGGRVDDADAGEDELARAVSAAVREAAEEVGIVVDPTSLIPLSHWTPPAMAPKRFTTWFFVAPWAGDEIRIDAHEIVDFRWIGAAEALAEALPLAPPTHVTLVTIDQARTFEGLRALVDRRGVERYLTVPSSLDGALVLLWEPDAGYASADASVAGARHRMTIPSNSITGGGHQTFERSEAD